LPLTCHLSPLPIDRTCACRTAETEEGREATGLRFVLYAVARGMEDAKAIRRGPRAIGKRIELRIPGRAFSRLISNIVGR
jgi:hypothetical protein